MATNDISDMLKRKDRQKVKERWCERIGAILKESYQRKSILREPGKLGTKHAVKFSKGTWHQIKIRERKVHREVLSKSGRLMSLCAPKSGERSHEKTWIQKTMRPQSSVGFTSSTIQKKLRFILVAMDRRNWE